MLCELQHPTLFSLAPFFVYPFKPFINIFVGKSYGIALKHFKAGHVGATNLAGHFICLVFCVFGNFGLLALLDHRIPQPVPSVRILSSLSAVVWIACLIPTKAPKVVTGSSMLLIGLAYLHAPAIPKLLFEQCAVGGLTTAIIGTNVIATDKKIKLPFHKLVSWLLLAPGFHYTFYLLSLSRYAESQISNTKAVTIGTMCLLTLLSALPNPLKKVVVGGMLLCRIAYILTGIDEWFYLSCGFMSSLCQGICHFVTEEQATLISHENRGGEDELALEYAHVVYFPNIALETIYDKVNQKSESKGKNK